MSPSGTGGSADGGAVPGRVAIGCVPVWVVSGACGRVKPRATREQESQEVSRLLVAGARVRPRRPADTPGNTREGQRVGVGVLTLGSLLASPSPLPSVTVAACTRQMRVRAACRCRSIVGTPNSPTTHVDLCTTATMPAAVAAVQTAVRTTKGNLLATARWAAVAAGQQTQHE